MLKMNKKTKEEIKQIEKDEIKIQILKSKIEISKTGFDRYVNVLTRSAFLETCTGGAYFNELFHGLLKRGAELLELENPEINKKEKEKLRSEWFFGENQSGSDLSEQEKEELILEENLKYWEGLEEWAKNNLSNLNDKLKKKIVIDSIKQQDLWSKQFDRNSKLYSRLDKLKNKTKVNKK